MHLGAKKLAFLGLLAAITVVLIILSGVFDFNTLFLLAAASFCVGIAFRETGIRIAAGFCMASIILGLLLAPNKFHCITFAAMGIYLLASEYSYDRLVKLKNQQHRKRLLWIVKYLIFNIMYIPSLIFLPRLFYEGKVSQSILLILIVAGQAGLFIYDMAYVYFQGYIWSKLRRNLGLQ
jgi:hypothetical protein